MKKKMIWIAPLAITCLALLVFLGGEVVKELWNWLLPSLFGWRQITFWQAIGMLALCRILFGGWGGHGSHRPRWGRRRDNMTPEDRERFRQGMRARCGFGPAVSSTESEGARGQ